MVFVGRVPDMQFVRYIILRLLGLKLLALSRPALQFSIHRIRHAAAHRHCLRELIEVERLVAVA